MHATRQLIESQTSPSEAQLAEMRKYKEYFPYRIIYGALHSQTDEFIASAVTTMRIPNKLIREGWTVWILRAR